MGPTKEKIEALEKEMKTLNISRSDIEEKFIKSSGKGGQKVNKTNSGVFLRHKQTNLSVKCQKTRSQAVNRYLALRSLVEKIKAHENGMPDKELSRIKKIQKQKKRRKRRSIKKQKV